MKVKIAVLQYDVPEETKASISKLDEMVSQASWIGSQLVVAPETSIGNGGEVKDTGVDYFSDLVNIAKKNKVFLATSYYKKENGKFINQGYIVSPDGKEILSHRKIYPAKPEVENIGVEEGKCVNVKKTELGNLGMLICKDGFNKFSHFIYGELGKKLADIICVPTWSLTWKDIDTQEYVKAFYTYGAFLSRAYVLVSGNLNKSTNSFGRSLIVSPIRGVIKEGSRDKKEILSEELDLGEVKKAREFDSWWQPKKRIL